MFKNLINRFPTAQLNFSPKAPSSNSTDIDHPSNQHPTIPNTTATTNQNRPFPRADTSIDYSVEVGKPLRVLVQTKTHFVPGNKSTYYTIRMTDIENLICQHIWKRNRQGNSQRILDHNTHLMIDNLNCWFLVDHYGSDPRPDVDPPDCLVSQRKGLYPLWTMACVPNAVRTSPSRPPLLHLTPEIRLRLYRYLGLASWNGRPYQFDLRGGRASCRAWVACPQAPIDFHGLLISCRTIYAEAAALLYAANIFVVHHYAPTQLPGFHSLGTFTEASLRSLSQLQIVVNEATCHNRVTENDHTGNCCCQGREDQDDWSDSGWCRQKHCGIHQAPLLSYGGTSADDAQRAWHSAAAQLFSCITPGRLALSLVCDIDPQHPRALHLAESILEPLHLLPRSYLSKCRIRLAKTPDGPLQQLAQDAAVHASGLPTPVPHATATAALASLPHELHVRILEYTDLVVPRRQVIWSRQDRAYAVLRFRREGVDPPLTPDEVHGEQFFECFRDRPEGCFCRRRHAVFSLNCKCWAPPGPALFLVCRTLSQAARYVFFSRNRFIVFDYKAYPVWRLPPQRQPGSSSGPGEILPDSPNGNSYPFERFAASEFLRDVVPASALAHLRFLELVFPPYPSTIWPGPDHPATQDWLATVAWLRDGPMLSLPALTLRMMVIDESNGAPDRPISEDKPEEGEALVRAYAHIVRPLRGLGEQPLGLARFYAHFRYRWEGPLCDPLLIDPSPPPGPWYDPWFLGRSPPPGPWYDPWLHKKGLRERLERYVMGDARYDSLCVDGGKEPMPSDWDQMAFAGRLVY